MAELRQNTWELDEWYAQDVAGNADYKTPRTLWVWGDSGVGQLGLNYVNDQYGDRSSPIQLGSGTDWKSIGGVKTDGTMWAWGGNENGHCGQNSVNNGYSSPVQVGTSTDWALKLCGVGEYTQDTASLTVAVKTDGTLWTWGKNSYGQLALNDQGPGQSTARSSPTQVGSSTDWPTSGEDEFKWAWQKDGESIQVIKTDGTLWNWGAGPGGYLAHDNNNNYSSPTQVGSGTDWKYVSSYGYTSYYIKTNGSLWSVGHNGRGAVGDNTIINRSSPIQLPGTTWKMCEGQVGASGGGTAVKTDGTLWSWGRNEYGNLGFNDRTDRSSPTQIGTDTTWDEVTAGTMYGNAAFKTDGTLWIWGLQDNHTGQLGLNQYVVSISSPTQIGGTDWVETRGGGGHTMRGLKRVGAG
tara:strand:- start:92 stop:1315 length:1224 start_codon:yes stop_codon:yes gene_type:complete